jgi:hypothetical protein
MGGIESVATMQQIGVAVMGKAMDTVKTSFDGIQKMINEIPAPATSGYGDILDIRA